MSQDNSTNNSVSNLSDSTSSDRVKTPQTTAETFDASPYQRHLLILNNSASGNPPSNFNSSSSVSLGASQKPGLLQQLPKLNTSSGIFNQPPNLLAINTGINLSPTLNGQPSSRKSSFIGNVNTSPIGGGSNNLVNSITQLSLNTAKPGTSNNNNNNASTNNSNNSLGYSMKIRNVPYDISSREVYAIFSLANSFLGADLFYDQGNNLVINARFSSINETTSVARILDNKQIFGPSYLPVRIDLEELALTIQQANSNNSNNNPATSNGNTNTKSKSTNAPPSASLMSPSIALSSLNNSLPLQSPQTVATPTSLYHQQITLPKRHSSATSASRSRFLFNNEFNNSAISENISSPIDLPAATPTNAGKSLLLMETQADAREYEQLVRDPWNSNNNEQNPKLLGKLSGSALGSQPPTPIGFEWGSSEPNGRRASLSFFPNGLKQTSQLNNPASNNNATNNRVALNKSTSPQSNVASLNNPVPNGSAVINQSQTPAPQPANPNSSQGNGVDLSLLARVPLPSNPADQNPPCNTLYVGNLPPDATEAELRALFSPQKGFRRLSFKNKAPNNSGSNSHSHGPMCFVEFEDVGYATRALAELYGSALPRPGGISNKGGIRLSFSKNPLGVRGPGQRRGSSNYTTFQTFNSAAQQQQQQQQQLQGFPPHTGQPQQQQHQQPPTPSQLQSSQGSLPLLNSNSVAN